MAETNGSAGNMMDAWVKMGSLFPSKSASDYCREIAQYLRTTPDAWCKGCNARTGDGRALSDPRSPWARQLCTVGLLMRFIDSKEMCDAVAARLTRVITPLNGVLISLPVYNDRPETQLADIIAMFESAALLPRDYDEVCAATEPQKNGDAPVLAESNEISGIKSEPPADDDLDVALAKKLIPWSSIMSSIKAVASSSV